MIWGNYVLSYLHCFLKFGKNKNSDNDDERNEKGDVNFCKR